MCSKAHRNGVKILIVDDTPVALKALKYILLGMGCEVVTAVSGKEAIKLLDPMFDIIFIDYFMPEMNGDEVTKKIREQEKSFDKKKQIYIVGVTANDSEEIINSCLECGMNKVIIKPIHPENIEELLEDLVN